jgi:hypothetical protein
MRERARRLSPQGGGYLWQWVGFAIVHPVQMWRLWNVAYRKARRIVDEDGRGR